MEKSPIILIPGIQGTKLSNTNELDFKVIWSGVRKFFSNIHLLTLAEDGLSDLRDNVIIERSDVENLAYSEMVNYLKELGHKVYIFGYDWRKSNAVSAGKLEVFVQRLQRKLNAKRVSFITHSMGGLVLSAYLKKLGTSESINERVNKIIFTVPPFLGSIEATFNLSIGKSKLFNSSDDFRKVGRTFPGLYELLPVYKGAYVFEDGSDPGSIDHYDFDTYWQQHLTKADKHNIIKSRISELREVRSQNDLVFDLSGLDEETRRRIIVLVGGGEDTKTRVEIQKNVDGLKYYFNFEKYDETQDGGDGTVPLESSAVFKKSIDTFQIDTTWYDRRIDSKFIQSDWHSFFLNNGKIQTIVKRFLSPDFVDNDEWYQTIGKKVKKLN